MICLDTIGYEGDLLGWVVNDFGKPGNNRVADSDYLGAVIEQAPKPARWVELTMDGCYGRY